MQKKNDLKIRIGSKTEVLWDKIKREAEMLIQSSKDNLVIQSALLELADEKIKEEQEKHKV